MRTGGFFILVFFLEVVSIFLASGAWGLCIKSGQAHLRKRPSSVEKINWVVGRYMPLEELARQGRWIRVRDIDREEHWVHRSQVTTSFPCVVVKARYANVRTRPKNGAPLAEIPFVDRYTPLKKIERDEEWLQVEDGDGRRGWIHDSTVWAPVRSVRIEY